ncbi:MAG: hypothetical protein J0M18_06220, partial [Ignavibacteria bacterium]|nr:hypothetical protein [Ignavibacteria bacterium]
SLDRSHKSLVNNLAIKLEDKTIVITIGTKNNIEPTLEMWGVNLRKDLFEQSFGLELKIVFQPV